MRAYLKSAGQALAETVHEMRIYGFSVLLDWALAMLPQTRDTFEARRCIHRATQILIDQREDD